MPFIIGDRRRGTRTLAAAFAFAALITAPAHAAGNIANPYDCTPQPTLAQSFTTWGDYALYTPVLNAGLENGSTGWRLTRAAVIAGNEPWKIGGSSHSSALDLPAGSSAITAPICIDPTYPYFRLFARNAGASTAGMKIDVLFYDSRGNVLNSVPYYYAASTSAWQPTGTIKIGVFTIYTTVAAAPVAFRFTPLGPSAHYVIDDVYVDPWARG